MPCSLGSGSQLAQGVHLHQSLAPPGPAVSVLQQTAATHAPQLDSRITLGHSAAAKRTSPWPHSDQAVGERGSNVSEISISPGLAACSTEPGSELQHCFSHRRAVVGLEPCWGAEFPPPPILHPSDKARGQWISAVLQLTEILVDAPLRICLTNSHNLSLKFITLFLHSRTPATAPVGCCALVG